MFLIAVAITVAPGIMPGLGPIGTGETAKLAVADLANALPHFFLSHFRLFNLERTASERAVYVTTHAFGPNEQETPTLSLHIQQMQVPDSDQRKLQEAALEAYLNTWLPKLGQGATFTVVI